MHRLWTTQHRRWEVENKQLWRRSEGERVKSPKEEPFRGSERDLMGMRESPRGSGDGGGVVCGGGSGGSGERLSGGGSGEDSLEKTLWRELSLERTLWRTLSGEILPGEILPGGHPGGHPTHPPSLLQSPTTRPKTGDPNPPHKGKKGRGKGGFTHSNPQNFSGGEPPDPPQLPQDRPTVGRKDKKGGRARFARDPTKSIELIVLFQTALSPPLHLLSFQSYSTPNFQTSHGVIRRRIRGTHTPSWGAISRGHTQVQNENLDALDFARMNMIT